MKTLEAVQTAWPEIYPHLKAAIDAAPQRDLSTPRALLPMISTLQMNDVLGIPKEMQVAA